jgi:phosphatidylcholine synthase
VLFAAWAAWANFAEGTWAHWGLIASSIYLCIAGIAQQILPERPRRIA